MALYDTEPPIELIWACFRYDAERGVLFWKRRPTEHFKNPKAWKTFDAQFAGREAFPTIGSHGYRCGTFQCNGVYYRALLHRLIWAYINGEWPKGEIDHIDCDRLNNKIQNLREASSAQNKQNRGRQHNNQAGLKGVIPAPSGRFIAQIRLGGRSTHLGTFDTPEQAHAVYVSAAREHHGEFARW